MGLVSYWVLNQPAFSIADINPPRIVKAIDEKAGEEEEEERNLDNGFDGI